MDKEMNHNNENDSVHRMQPDVVEDILKTSGMCMWNIFPGDGTHVGAVMSEEARQIFGIDKDRHLTKEELYQWWYEHIYPEDMPTVKHYFSKLEACERYEITYRWLHPTLGIRIIRCGGIGRRRANGELVLEGYHYDVTNLLERSQKDSLVAQSMASTYLYLCFMDLTSGLYSAYRSEDPAVIQNLPENGRITDLCRIAGEKLSNDKDRKALQEFLDPTTFNERLKDTNSISIVCKGAYVTWVRFSWIVLDRNADGTISHMMGAIKNVSGQHEHELKLIHSLNESIEADRSRTMMFQNMIHEIRTPLNAMFGFSQLLCVPGVEVTDEQKREYFNIINNSYRMLTKLIDDVLDIVNAEHGNFSIRKKDFLVNNMCRDTVRLAQMRVQAGVRLYFTSEVPDDYCINSDEQRIEQVLINFLTNACKHTYKGEIHLHVSAKENPGHLTFSVTDTGTGVAPEMADDIFKRYKKANYNVKGTGIGLHICSIIAERLNAKVMLDKSYTRGARFLFII